MTRNVKNLSYVQYMCIVESLKLKRYGYIGLASARPIDVQTSSLALFHQAKLLFLCNHQSQQVIKLAMFLLMKISYVVRILKVATAHTLYAVSAQSKSANRFADR